MSTRAQRWLMTAPKMLLAFPEYTLETAGKLRKPRLAPWDRNRESSRAWLALNMMTEARAGFAAFNQGGKDDREVDFVLLRRKLAADQSCLASCTSRSCRRTAEGPRHG